MNAMRSLLLTLSPNCRQVARLLSRSLDRPLQFWTSLGMKLHLALCISCRRYARQARCLHEELPKHEHAWIESCPERLPAEARQRLKTLLRQSQR
jgi:hypothetical protein